MTEPGDIPVLEAWRALLAATVDAVMIVDHQGRIELCNPAAEKLFGYQATELLGRSVEVLMTEPDRHQHDDYMKHYQTTRERRIIGIGREVMARRRDGSEFPVHLSIGEIAGSSPPRYVGQLHDVSERRASLEALRRERDLARRYLQIAQVALLVVDGQNRVLLINRKGCEVLHRSEAQVVGQDWLRLAVPEEHREEVAARLNALRTMPDTDKTEHYHEYSIADEGGALHLMAWRGTRMDDTIGGTGTLLLSGDDITDRRIAEEAARRTTERMSEVSRLASLGEMAGGIAHEINQPLTAISNYAQASYRMLTRGDADMNDIGDALQEIGAQALRAGEIIRRLRNLIRKQETQQEPTAIAPLINDVIGFCQNDAKLNEIRIIAEVEDGLPLLLIDKVQIQQVVFNLLRNAMEAVMQNAPDDRLVEILCDRDRDTLRVRICDNGAGVPADFLARMFTPLQTTKASGTGLGLAISRSIAEAHQGSLRHVPAPGHGACFELRLPIANGVDA